MPRGRGKPKGRGGKSKITMSNREVSFYNTVMQQRPGGTDLRSQAEVVRMALYINRTVALAQSFEIAEFPAVNAGATVPSSPQAAENTLLPAYYQVENFLNAIYARNVFEIDGNLQRDFVGLDDSWRTRATTYVTHIREAVNKATDLPEGLRQSILNRLNELQNEIDRQRTRVSAAVAILVELCTGIGAGAKHLEPAVKLVERLTGAFNGLRKDSQESSGPKQIPPPDQLGLPNYSNEENGSE